MEFLPMIMSNGKGISGERIGVMVAGIIRILADEGLSAEAGKRVLEAARSIVDAYSIIQRLESFEDGEHRSEPLSNIFEAGSSNDDEGLIQSAYRKRYKTMYARYMKGAMSGDEMRAWKSRAEKLRSDALSGEISPEEFTNSIEALGD